MNNIMKIIIIMNIIMKIIIIMNNIMGTIIMSDCEELQWVTP